MNSKQVLVIQKVLKIFSENNYDYFLLGATARNILFEQREIDAVRKTNDWDFAVCIPSWSDFEKIATELKAQGFEKTKSVHTFKSDGIILDIVPFGGVANSAGNIEFPKTDGMSMNVFGFNDFIKHCEIINWKGIELKIGSFPALLGSKILAFNDRRKSDDSKDIEVLAENYEQVVGTERYYSEVNWDNANIPSDNRLYLDYYLAGRSLGCNLSEESRKHCIGILESWLEDTYPEIGRFWKKEEDDEGGRKRLEYMLDGLKNL